MEALKLQYSLLSVTKVPQQVVRQTPTHEKVVVAHIGLMQASGWPELCQLICARGTIVFRYGFLGPVQHPVSFSVLNVETRELILISWT